MPLAKKILIIAACSIGYTAGFGLVGGIVSWIFEVMSVGSDGVSGAVYYVSWFVAAMFCGFLSYQTAGEAVSPKSPGDWNTKPDAPRTGLLVLGVHTLVLAALFFPAYLMSDDLALTLTFLITVFATVIFAYFSFQPKTKR